MNEWFARNEMTEANLNYGRCMDLLKTSNDYRNGVSISKLTSPFDLNVTAYIKLSLCYKVNLTSFIVKDWL